MSEFFLFLQVFWFFAIGAVLILYACTAGFDFGATMILPFIRKEEDRRVILNIVGPTWDGNQTWLVFAGGALFVIWPAVYASVFSGLYAAILCMLWSMFLRPPGFEYRGKIDNAKWRTFWNWSLFVSSVIPVLIFGLLLGNLYHGIDFSFDKILLQLFNTGSFWGLLNLPGCFFAVTSLLMVLMHGSALLYRRTEGHLHEKFSKLFMIFASLFLVLFTVTGLLVAFAVKGYILIHQPANPTYHILDNVVHVQRSAWITSYAHYPWKIAPPVIAYCTTLLAMVAVWYYKSRIWGFWLSCCSVAATVATAGASLFPFVAPSSVMPNESMTVWNASSTFLRLRLMFYVTLVVMVIIFIYKMYAYWAVWHKKKTLVYEDIAQDESY